jgi:predicted transcriptional regulator of viral defense system
MKTLGPRGASLIAELNERRTPIFSIQDAAEITGLAYDSARRLIGKLADRGLITRLKPGLFNLVPFERGHDTEHVSNPYLIARSLARTRDYFISHGSAFELHRMVTQPQLTIFASSTRRVEPQNVHGYEFRFIKINPDRLFGITDHWLSPEESVRISDLERTLIDGLDLPHYVGGVAEVAKGMWMRRRDLNVPRVIDYALKLDVGAVIRRLGYLLELYDLADRQRLEALRIALTPTFQRLDPLLPNEGPMLSRWKIRLNVEPDELRAIRST